LKIPAGNSATVHDPVSGNAVEMTAETVLRVGATPVFVTWQGGELALTR
jgi:hypothetical protein